MIKMTQHQQNLDGKELNIKYKFMELYWLGLVPLIIFIAINIWSSWDKTNWIEVIMDMFLGILVISVVLGLIWFLLGIFGVNN